MRSTHTPWPPLAACELERRDTPASSFLAFGAAAGGQPLVQLFRPDGTTLAQFAAFESEFRGGVRTAASELDGNPDTVELVAAAGPGGGPHVKVFSVNTTSGDVATIGSFFAFDPSFAGGVRVAVGEFAGGTDRNEIVVAADAGGGPRVRVMSFEGGGPASIAGPLGDFFAFAPEFTGGVRVAAGELDGNAATDELVVAAGAGGGSRVRVLGASGAEVRSYFAEPGSAAGTNAAVDTTGGQSGLIRTDLEDRDFSQRSTALNTLAIPVAAGVSGTATGTGTAGTGFTTGFNNVTGFGPGPSTATGGVLPGATPATTIAPGVNFSTVASPGSPSAIGNGVLTNSAGTSVPFGSGTGFFGTGSAFTGSTNSGVFVG